MAYIIPPGAVIQFQILGRLHGQRTRNVFHYRYAGSANVDDGAAELTALADDFHDEVAFFILQQQSDEFTLEQIMAQAIAPTRYRAVFKDVNIPGAVEGNSVPSGVAVVLRRFAELSGRHFQGRVYIPGLPVASESDSQVLIDDRAAWSAVAQKFLTVLTGPEGGENYRMVVSTDIIVTSADEVFGAALDINLRYQRRREVGVGE